MNINEYISNFEKRASVETPWIQSLVVNLDGEKIHEKHWAEDIPRNTQSHTKSFLSAAIGIAIGEGKISLDDRFVDFFPEEVPEGRYGELSKISLRHFLTMSSGFDKGMFFWIGPEYDYQYENTIRFIVNHPMKTVPGIKFCYSAGDSIIAGRMLEKATDTPLDEYLFKNVFSPLEIPMPEWSRCLQGHPIGAGWMKLRAIDMIKIGQLFLDGGKWHGREIVPENWVKTAIQKQIEVPSRYHDCHCSGYGYHFWALHEPGAFRAWGAGGQNTWVFPDSRLVLTTQVELGHDENVINDMLYEEIFRKV